MSRTIESVTLPEEGIICGYLSSIYEDPDISFALATPIVRKKIKLVSSFQRCREELAFSMKENIKAAERQLRKTYIVVCSSSATYRYDSMANKTRRPQNKNDNKCLASGDKWMKGMVHAGVKLVNHFEKINKWSQTKAYKVIIPKKVSLTKHAYYIVGSKWWSYSPHNFSLYLLLIRLGRYEEIQTLCKKHVSKDAFLKTLENLKVNHFGSNLVAKADKWYVLTKNLKEIYSHHCGSLKRCWSAVRDYQEGVYEFTHNHTDDKIAYHKLNSLCKATKE